MMTNRTKRRRRAGQSAVGEALIESLAEAVAFARGETELPVREVQPLTHCEVRLSAEDQRRVAEAILKPRAPVPALQRAERRHRRLFGRATGWRS